MEIEKHVSESPPLHHIIFVLFFTIGFVMAISLIGFLIGAKTGLFLLEGLIIVPALIYVVLGKYDLKKLFRLQSVNARLILLSLVIGCGISILADGLDRLFQLFLPMPELLQKQMSESFLINSPADFIIIVVSAVLFAGVFEEMLFRGFVQKTFEKEFDVSRAIIITSAIFGMIHLNPWWLVQITFFGFFLGLLAWKSDSIIPSMIVHFINNGLSIVFINLTRESSALFFYQANIYIPLMVIAFFITMVGFKLFFSIVNLEKNISAATRER